jgi:hypothetical protein
MKKVIFSGVCFVAGFILFCVLHIAHLEPSNPFYNYDFAWAFGSVLVVVGIVLGFIWLRKQGIMPIIASTFSFAPLLLLLLGCIPAIGIFFGIYSLQVIGVSVLES